MRRRAGRARAIPFASARARQQFRSHRRCRTAGPDFGELWSSRVVATAAEDRLNFQRNPHTSFAAASDCEITAILAGKLGA